MYIDYSSTASEPTGLNWGFMNTAFKHLALCCMCVSLTLMVRLLLYARFLPSALRYSELSLSLHVYLWFHVCGTILSIPYNVYVIVQFYLGNNTQRSDTHFLIIYWLGQWQNTYNAISPLVVFFLAVGRCAALLNAGNPVTRAAMERLMFCVSVITILLAFGASTGVYLAEMPLDMDILMKLGCESVSCLMLRWRNLPQLFFKCAVGFGNILSCVYFLILLHKISAAKHIKNRSIIVTLCFELGLNILPAFVSLGFNFFGSGPVSNVVSLGAALDACCCAVYYSWVFLGHKNGKVKNGALGNIGNNALHNKNNNINDNKVAQLPGTLTTGSNNNNLKHGTLDNNNHNNNLEPDGSLGNIGNNAQHNNKNNINDNNKVAQLPGTLTTGSNNNNLKRGTLDNNNQNNNVEHDGTFGNICDLQQISTPRTSGNEINNNDMEHGALENNQNIETNDRNDDVMQRPIDGRKQQRKPFHSGGMVPIG